MTLADVLKALDNSERELARVRAENKILRAGLVQSAREKQVLEEVIVRQNAYVVAACERRGEPPPGAVQGD